MIYSGKAITVQAADDGIAELCFDLQDESVNKPTSRNSARYSARAKMR
jgi:hypothetical protein